MSEHTSDLFYWEYIWWQYVGCSSIDIIHCVWGDLSNVWEAVPEVGQYTTGIGVYFWWYLSVKMCVILKSIFTSSFTFRRASSTSSSFCLFTWMTYHVMFRMEMTCTKVSRCFVHSFISRFICHLIAVKSFIVAVSLNHCTASPKKVVGSFWVMDCQHLIIYWELVQPRVVVLPFVWLVYIIGILLMLVNSPRWALSMKLDVNGWCCSFISSSCAGAFWWLNMCSCSITLPKDIWTVIIHEHHVGYAFRPGWNSMDSHLGLSCSSQHSYEK